MRQGPTTRSASTEGRLHGMVIPCFAMDVSTTYGDGRTETRRVIANVRVEHERRAETPYILWKDSDGVEVRQQCPEESLWDAIETSRRRAADYFGADANDLI